MGGRESSCSGFSPRSLRRGSSVPLESYVYNEGRYCMLRQSDPELAERLRAEAEKTVRERWERYSRLAAGC